MENKISKTDRGFADYELENITKLLKKCKKEKDVLELSGLRKKNRLVDELCNSKYCKIQSINNLIDVLNDILTLKHKFRPGAIRPGNIGEELYEVNRVKYNPSKEKDNDIARLIDTDIISWLDMSATSCNLIYDIIYNDYLHNSPYDVIATYYNKSANLILKKALISSAIRGFLSVISNLKSIIEQYEKKLVEIYIPFLNDYCRPAKHVLELIYTAHDIAKSIETVNFETLDVLNPCSIKTIGSVELALQNFEAYLLKENNIEASLIVHNERICRKHITGAIPKDVSAYRRYFTESTYYEKQEKKETKAIETAKNARRLKYDKKKTRTGVLVCMLKSANNIDDNLIKKIVHFALDGQEQIWGKGRSTTIDYLRKLDETILTQANKEEIEEFLKEYQIPPEVIASLPHAIK